MVNYRQFETTKDVAYNIYNALKYCKKHNEDVLMFEKGSYQVYAERASEELFCLSNHSDPGFKRCLFLLNQFKNFTIDGNGSEFIFNDVLTPVIISHCENVHLKNVIFSSKRTLTAQYTVIDSNGNNAILSPDFGTTFIHAGELYEGDYKSDNYKLRFMVVYDEDGMITKGKAADYYIAFNDDRKRTKFIDNGDGTITANNLPTLVNSGQKIVFNSGRRIAANIFINNSKNTNISNVTIHSGVGMGVIAQNCDSVSIDKLDIYPINGRCHSVNVDATHFVHCRGKISIKNCMFSSQLDDALNVHSIYFKIIDKTENKLILKQVNREQKGIDIIKSGDIIETCDSESLLPNGKYKVISAKRINLEISEIIIEGNTDNINIGDVADEVSWAPDVIFENCIINNVRGRGMLLASSGKIIIKNNYFKTTGAAIKFESDGKFWYESGRTKDVLITKNIFDNCKYCEEGNSVITISPKEKIEEERYFHGKIEIIQNEFKECNGYLAYVSNTDSFIFKDNTISNHHGEPFYIEHCKHSNIDI